MSHLKNILLQQEEIWQNFHSYGKFSGVMEKKLYHVVDMLEEDTEKGINWMEQNKLLEIHRFSLFSHAC